MKIQEKQELIKKHSPHTSVMKNLFFSFLFGAIICALGEVMYGIYFSLIGEAEISNTLVTLTVILIAAVLTGLGLFDNIARIAGAGTLVPVTGFSNAVVSEAMDSRSEGYVLGVGSKIFTVAGPVILYGLCSGILYGVIIFVIGLIP
jgi:stage V sporulation protein AC